MSNYVHRLPEYYALEKRRQAQKERQEHSSLMQNMQNNNTQTHENGGFTGQDQPLPSTPSRPGHNWPSALTRIRPFRESQRGGTAELVQHPLLGGVVSWLLAVQVLGSVLTSKQLHATGTHVPFVPVFSFHMCASQLHL